MMTLKIIGFSIGAVGMPFVGMLDAVAGDASKIADETPTFVLALICIVFALTIVALFTRLVKTDERHHKEWKAREKDLKEERVEHDKEMKDLLRANTSAITAVNETMKRCEARR